MKQLIVFGLIGAAVGLLIGVIVALTISRGDRRLRERDEIANCVGAPVLASFPVAHPSDAAAWTELLVDYDPGTVDALHLRQALQQLGVAGLGSDSSSQRGSSSLAVLSLSSDPGAVAIGPQLAVFAASLGIPTALVIGPQQDETVTAALRIASSVPPPSSSRRSHHLRVVVASGPDADGWSGAVLTVVVAVIDTHNPQVSHTMPATATVLGVSAGRATGEQLARVAASAVADGHEITGILVADPEPTDRTTGRMPHLTRRFNRAY